MSHTLLNAWTLDLDARPQLYFHIIFGLLVAHRFVQIYKSLKTSLEI